MDYEEENKDLLKKTRLDSLFFKPLALGTFHSFIFDFRRSFLASFVLLFVQCKGIIVESGSSKFLFLI